jgi:hypothetical protein
MTDLFIAEPDGTCRVSLRRFCYGAATSDHRHGVITVIGESEPEYGRDADGIRRTPEDLTSHDDPRWPQACACGYLFTAEDQWQVIQQSWYEGGGHRFAWGIGAWEGPPGAMIRAEWADHPGRPPAWIVFLPNRTHWSTNDRPAGGPGNQFGPYWDVTGTAPDISVHPSIDDRTPGREWHGWIRDGAFVNA